MQWNPTILEENIAPGITTFTTASIPDLSEKFPQAEHWLANHFLNAALRVGWPDRYRPVVVAFLRRVGHANSAYHHARHLTLDYLDGNDPLNPRIRLYYDAVAEWENFAVDATMAFDFFKWINAGNGAFTKNDGTMENRLYEIGNKVKHVTQCVDSGQCGTSDTLPLWIDAVGMKSFGTEVTYEEAAEILMGFCTLADELQDPITFVENTKLTKAGSAV